MLFNFGTIRNKLIAAFTVIVCLTVGISLMAIFLFGSSREWTHTIITMDMPAMVDTQEMSVIAKGIAAAAPSLAATDTKADLTAAKRELEGQLKKLNQLIIEFPKQPSDKANHQRIRIHDYIKEFEPVIKEIYDGRREIISIREKVFRLVEQSSTLSKSLMNALEPIKTSAGFNLSLTLMELAQTDQSEAEFWRLQAFQIDLPHFQYSMEMGLAIQQMHSLLLQAVEAPTRSHIIFLQDSFAREVERLNEGLMNFGSKGALQPLLGPIQALIANGQDENGMFILQSRRLITIANIKHHIEQARMIATHLTQAAQDFSGSIISSARHTADRIYRATRTGTVIALSMALATILMAFMIGWRVVARDIVKRIASLRLKMVEGQQGNLNLMINTRGSDEIADMSKAFAYFVKQMRKDIANREENERRIREAMRQSEAANIAKSNFLANMSHEIRTPMNGIIGYSALMKDTALNAEQREYLDAIKTSSDHLLGVINDILDFSKIEAGHLELEKIPFNLSDTLENAVDTMAVKAREKDLRIISQVADHVPNDVVGDPGRLRQVIVNLLSNAIKFTRVGDINLGCGVERKTDDAVHLHISVADSGVGIAVEKQNAIFDSFEQADTSTTREFGGTGLGLSISKELVEMMGGRMWVESKGEDPAATANTGASSSPPRPGPGSTFHFTVHLGLEVANDPSLMKHEPHDLIDLRVLIVGRDEIPSNALGQRLTTWRISYDVAGNSQDALGKVLRAAEAHTPFDVVVSDERLPDMDGLELISRIHADPILGDIISIMIASETSTRDIARGQKIGLGGYLTKPVAPAELYEMMMMALAYRKKLDAAKEFPVVTRQLVQGLKRPALLKILVVEDSPINQKMAVRMLETKGYDITTADDGRQAFDCLKKGRYDLVLMDVQMPVMDGIAATKAIRNLGAKGRLPIVAMTANAMKGDKKKCLEAGMDDYISKPISTEELFNVIDKQLILKQIASQ